MYERKWGGLMISLKNTLEAIKTSISNHTTQITNMMNLYPNIETIVGTYIDGKPIYRICKHYTKTSAGEDYLDIGIKNVDKFLNAEVRMVVPKSTGHNACCQPYYWDSGDYIRVWMNTPNSGYIRVSSGGNWPVRPFNYFIIYEYTKTTD